MKFTRSDGYAMIDLIDSLRSFAAAVERLDVLECNDGLTPAQETRRKGILQKATNLALFRTNKTWTVYHQTDPRGCSLYLIPAKARTPGMIYSEEGIAISPANKRRI